MKVKTLLALAALMALAVGADAQAPTKTPPMAPKKAAPKKVMPMRDPKTGKFVKTSHAKTMKKMPMRDPKTGKFIKKKS